ncbi:hypothetical protein A5844_001359 [Enterococcus sp. 10A9_DIV0425]|uniref:Uncharacterized protein n=1 Tax=Candidatus Enterococcus wittei TaxID=1987383 RepID=A0A242K0W8_9ENTE|nr:hypothetical protein A5844_001359 [Enterococcus sp. 10A9_DIV0425]
MLFTKQYENRTLEENVSTTKIAFYIFVISRLHSLILQ